MEISPSTGSISPRMVFSNIDLPQPTGPTIIVSEGVESLSVNLPICFEWSSPVPIVTLFNSRTAVLSLSEAFPGALGKGTGGCNEGINPGDVSPTILLSF